jgi:hypothetical protein
MKPLHNVLSVLTGAVVLGFCAPTKCEEPCDVAAPAKALRTPFVFSRLCLRDCYCPKPMCGIKCPLPSFACRDDYCLKPLPCIPLCWRRDAATTTAPNRCHAGRLIHVHAGQALQVRSPREQNGSSRNGLLGYSSSRTAASLN